MGDLLMKHVAPGLGCLVAWLLFSSPFKAVLQVRQSRALGSLNPLPLVAMWANCLGWLVYSFITTDIYVLVSNIPGLLLGSFMTISCYGYADERTRNTMLQGIMFFASLLMGAGILISFGGYDHKAVINIWGCATVFILVIFYTAPLSALAEVFRTRSSAALYLPFAVMNTINGLLWTAYGLAVPDGFIFGPNAVGTVFGGLQVILCMVFPSKPADRYKSPPPSEIDPEAGSLLYDNIERS